MKIRIHWAIIAFVLGALMNVTLQLTTFIESWHTFRQYEPTFGEFIRQLSWLMLLVTGGFFAMIGALVQRKLDERAEKKEIEAYLEGRKKG